MRNRASPWWLVALALYATGAAAEPDTFGLGTGRDGALTVLKPGAVINRYAQVTGPLAPGDLQVFVSSSEGFADGDLVMVLQTTGIVPEPPRGEPAPVDLRNDPVGRWELARVAAVSSGELRLKAPLVHSYAGRVTQVIRVPEFTDVTVRPGASLKAQPWNGETGGVLAFLATGTVNNEGELQASGAGFRGGTAEQQIADLESCSLLPREVRPGARRGEGVSVLSYGAGEMGMDNASNGGGGGICPMSGGGGGGNAGVGGRGGDSSSQWDVTRDIGGRGGAALRYSLINHLTLGGGGGKGHGQDESGSPAGAGGGAIFVRAEQLTGSGALLARGEAGGSAGRSGASGGGAGGSIYLRLAGTAGCGSISARGGTGGSPVEGSLLQTGAGGGGGGGRVLYQAASTDSCPIDVEAGWTGLRKASEGAIRLGGEAQPTDGIIQLLPKGFSALDPTPPPPNTVLSANVTSPTNKTSVTFTYNGAGQGGVYKCQRWTGTPNHKWDDCGAVPGDAPNDTLQKTYDDLTAGTYTFDVYATNIDDDGNEVNPDPTPARFTWTVDQTPPVTRIVGTPQSPTAQTTATFSFGGAEDGGRYLCREWIDTPGSYLDCGNAGAGGSPDLGTKTFNDLPSGTHTFAVQAEDAAGNRDTTGKQFSWTIINTKIVSSPPQATNQATASFTFKGAGAGGQYWCKQWKATADAGSPQLCSDAGSGGQEDTGSASYSGLTDGTYTFEVYSKNGAAQAAPASFTWKVDTAPPVTAISDQPHSPTSQKTAKFDFNGAGPGGRYLCREWAGAADGGSFQDCSDAGPEEDGPGTVSYDNLVDGNHTFEVYAEDVAGNRDQSPVSSKWRVDTLAPDTKFSKTPPRSTNEQTAVFEFSANEGEVTFSCSREDAGFSECTSPVTWKDLEERSEPHTFRVYAKDETGNQETEAGAASYSWVVDLTPPVTVITEGPPKQTKNLDVTFKFGPVETGISYQCSVDNVDQSPCTNPMPVHVQEDVLHKLCVTAKDAAGNVDTSAECHEWTLDTRAPKTTISKGPSTPTSDPTATFEFSADEPGVAYMCSLDGATAASCTSPKKYTSVSEDPHIFRVYAVDAADNAETNGAEWSWTVDTTAPSPPTVDHPGEGQCTNGNTLAIDGTVEPRAVVSVFLNGLAEAVGTTTAGATGGWSVTVPLGNLSDGPHFIKVNAQDEAHNDGTLSSERKFTLDTRLPSTEIVTKPPVLSGSREARFTFDSDEEGVRFKCNLYDGKGEFDCTTGLELKDLADGTHTVGVYAVDCAGNRDPTTEVYQWTVDTKPPVVVITSPKENEAIGEASPLITGTSERSATVRVFLDDNDLQTPPVEGTVLVGADDTWNFQVRVALPNGNYTVSATATDLVGNIGVSFGPLPFRIDTTPPDTEITVWPPPVDIRDSADFTFLSTKGGTVFEYSLDKVPEQESDWHRVGTKYKTPSLKDGKHFLLVRAVDDAGNKDPEPAKAEWSIVAERPAIPEIIDPQVDFTVYSLTPTFRGTAVAGGSVELFIDIAEMKDETKPTAIATADAEGNWAHTPSDPMAEGPHTVVGRAINTYGNKGEFSAPITFTVAAPKVQAKAIGGGLGCNASSSNASPWLAVLGLLAVVAGRARRQRSP